MAVLEVKGVSYAYEKNRDVLVDVSTELETGKLYAVLGPSGSGKSTFLSLLGGLDLPTGGELLFEGERVGRGNLEVYRRKQISFIFQNYNLIDYMTPLENAGLTAKKEVRPILERLGLTGEEMRRNVLKLSGGQQQRVAIARALASDSPVILADEPTGNLDADTAAEITALLKESAHQFQKCVVVVTHSGAVAEQADVILRLHRGRLSRDH